MNNVGVENCYPSCYHYFYFDGTGFQWSTEDKCPEGYKLIDTKKRYVLDC